MNQTARFLPLLLVLFPVVGCGTGEPTSTVGDAASSRFLSIGTAPLGGAFFPVGGAIAEVLNENRGDRDWEFTAEATKGSQENIRRLIRGELDIALSNSAISYFAVRGEGSWKQPYPVRVLMTLAPNVALFVTPTDSGIRRIADMRGKRIVVGPAGSGMNFFIEPLLQAHGLTYNDFSPLYNHQTGAVSNLADGSAAAAFLGGAVPTASITQASSSQDIFFVPYEAEAMDELIDRYVFFTRATIPAGTYRGQSDEFNGLDVGSMHLIAAASTDEELIYQLTKTLWENRDEVVKKHPAGRAINPKNAVRNTGTEFHPGAVRFYREIGIWPEQQAAR